MPILSYFPGGSGGEVTVTVPTPSQQGSLTYTGEVLTPQWSDYDPERLTVSGTLSATEAGIYTAVFTPKVGYCWEDLSVDPISVDWSIGKAAGRATASVLSVSLDTVSSKTATFTVARLGDGAITVTSSKTSVASVSVSGDTVTVTSKAAGTAVITVSVAEGSNHTAPANITVDVSVFCVWEKYTLVSSSTSKLWIPSMDCSRSDLEDSIDSGDVDPTEDCDEEWTVPPEYSSSYQSVSVSNDGTISGGTGANGSSISKAKYTRLKDATWYYIGENTMSYGGGSYSGSLYCFEMTAKVTTTYSGDEYIEDVRSTDAGAYPSKGAQGGYWYVKK